MNNLVSIIIPCYNQGHFIQDALDSIDENKIVYKVEIIIVNDGSNDEETINKLDALSLSDKYIVINQKNMGLATARNIGIARAKGGYILPLDDDNKLTSEYINKGVALLISGKANIVYGKPIFFGDKTKKRKYQPQDFNIYDLLEGNYIDACAIYSKEVWIKNGGYDSQMPFQGYEDWEFWINAFSNGFKFHFLNKKLFYYRIVFNSMIDGFPKQKFVQIHNYIMNKHPDIFLYHLVKLTYIKRKYDRDIKRWLIAPFIFVFYQLGIIKSPDQKAKEKFFLYDPLSTKPK